MTPQMKEKKMENEQKIIRQQLRIYGRVQGVGFRYRAEYAAGLLGVSGWVRNCPGTAVEMEVQGSRDQIDRLLSMIGQGTYVSIDKIDRKEIPLLEHEHDFCVKD